MHENLVDLNFNWLSRFSKTLVTEDWMDDYAVYMKATTQNIESKVRNSLMTYTHRSVYLGQRFVLYLLSDRPVCCQNTPVAGYLPRDHLEIPEKPKISLG